MSMMYSEDQAAHLARVQAGITPRRLPQDIKEFFRKNGAKHAMARLTFELGVLSELEAASESLDGRIFRMSGVKQNCHVNLEQARRDYPVVVGGREVNGHDEGLIAGRASLFPRKSKTEVVERLPVPKHVALAEA